MCRFGCDRFSARSRRLNAVSANESPQVDQASQAAVRALTLPALRLGSQGERTPSSFVVGRLTNLLSSSRSEVGRQDPPPRTFSRTYGGRAGVLRPRPFLAVLPTTLVARLEAQLLNPGRR